MSPARRHPRGRGTVHGADLPVAGHLRGRRRRRRGPRTPSGPLLEPLHPNGRALVERLKAVGDLTLVLDECHHLLEVWGRLLAELLDELPGRLRARADRDAAEHPDPSRSALVDELFGDTVFSVSIPAVVREGDLAPFAELAWLTTPTPTENEWLAEQGERFAELTAALTDPAYGSTPFFAWLDRRFCAALRDDDPEQLDAALRMVHAGLLGAARRRAAHRAAPARPRPPTTGCC